MNLEIRIGDYTYNLPQDRIALHPLDRRDHSKLLIFRHGKVSHSVFGQIVNTVPENATLFFNNSKVIQARLRFEKETGAEIEVFLLHPVFPSSLLLDVMQSTQRCEWNCTIGNLKRWKENTALRKQIGSTVIEATLIDREKFIVRFQWTDERTFASIIAEAGETPLPPYLRRAAVPEDKHRYQTVYSNVEGAVAAPTAGLHFTPEILHSLKERGVKLEFVTLHVSAGTFQPVKTENAAEHPMHQEQLVVSRAAIEALQDEGRFIVAVGTTSMRTLESLYWFGVKLSADENALFHIDQNDPYEVETNLSLKDSAQFVLEYMSRKQTDTLVGETSIYIMPGYQFRVCKGLITNFHQPGSTLILLVAAFIGKAWKEVYNEALNNDYRFLSYGDSSILIP
jgi:S-adenosylmethionine:tRNA ribosyltransferase-isomerase